MSRQRAIDQRYYAITKNHQKPKKKCNLIKHINYAQVVEQKLAKVNNNLVKTSEDRYQETTVGWPTKMLHQNLPKINENLIIIKEMHVIMLLTIH